jgi:hypothetical protein
VIYPYTEWECYQAGMYDNPAIPASEYKRLSFLAADLLRDRDELMCAMSAAARQWPKGAASNMSRPWLGQAACCLRFNVPKWITCMVWTRALTDPQRAIANDCADVVRIEWEAEVRGAETLFGH